MEDLVTSQNELEKKYSVLKADNNQNNLKVLSAMLEKLDYKVRVAKSGEQTIQSVETLKPDIILLDIHMPGMLFPISIKGRNCLFRMRKWQPWDFLLQV